MDNSNYTIKTVLSKYVPVKTFCPSLIKPEFIVFIMCYPVYSIFIKYHTRYGSNCVLMPLNINIFISKPQEKISHL